MPSWSMPGSIAILAARPIAIEGPTDNRHDNRVGTAGAEALMWRHRAWTRRVCSLELAGERSNASNRESCSRCRSGLY